MTNASMTRPTQLIALSILVLSLAACGHDNEAGNRAFTAVDRGGNSMVMSALAEQADLSMFYQALLTTGVASELNEDTGYTIFAPTNAAFADINPRVYPCFYSVQCRVQVAAVLRNHIVPQNESVDRFSKWGGGIPTLGNRRLDVEEPYKGHYTVEGRRVLYQNENSQASHFRGHRVTLYHIDGLIAGPQELSPFRAMPVVMNQGYVTEKTVTTTRAPVVYPAPYPTPFVSVLVPGGNPVAPVIYVAPDEIPDTTTTQTTTIIHSTPTP